MPAPFALSNFVCSIPDVLQDAANKLWNPENQAQVLGPFVLRAFERYSKDSPLELVTETEFTGNLALPLPALEVLSDTPTPVFDPLFSILRSIEYPVDQQPPQYIDDTDFVLYRKPAGYFILLTADTPIVGNPLRMCWTARHAVDGSTIPDKDFYAVVDFAASLAAQQLATIYTQTGDPTFSADVVNYRSKGQEYQALAKMLRKRYFDHLGIDESNSGAAEVKPALAIGQQFEEMESGVGRLLHTKYSR